MPADYCHLSSQLRDAAASPNPEKEEFFELRRLDDLEPEHHPVTVVRLSPRRTTVTTPGGSSAVCGVDITRPLPVAAAVGQVMRMEHDAAVPSVVHHVASWARPLLVRYERDYQGPIVFDLFTGMARERTETDAQGWGPDDEDERIIAQARGEV